MQTGGAPQKLATALGELAFKRQAGQSGRGVLYSHGLGSTMEGFAAGCPHGSAKVLALGADLRSAQHQSKAPG